MTKANQPVSVLEGIVRSAVALLLPMMDIDQQVYVPSKGSQPILLRYLYQ
ncbi:hypothetical protein [Fodinibius sp. SL11]